MSTPVKQLLVEIQHAALQTALTAIVASPEKALQCLNVYGNARVLEDRLAGSCQEIRNDAPIAVPGAPTAPAPETPAEQAPAKPKANSRKKAEAVDPPAPAAETPAAELPEEETAGAYPVLDLKYLSSLEVAEIRQAGKEWWMTTIDELTKADAAKGDQLRLEMRAEIGKHKEGSVSIKDVTDDKVLEFWGTVKKLAAKFTA